MMRSGSFYVYVPAFLEKEKKRKEKEKRAPCG
jgi:hypothetical protein